MKRLRIFVVDDDRDFAESLADVLESRGHAVDLAFSGEEAVRRFRDHHYDITFMDVRLPGMNGVESFVQIRKMKPDAKVVMMTAYSVEELLNQAIGQGALGILHKPFAPEQLIAMLDGVMPAGIVLVVDDDPDFADSTERYLVSRGYKVLVARSGQDAVDKALANGIDVLVLDLRLPILSGLEVFLELRKQGRHLPTIIVTGYAEEEAGAIDKLRELSVSGCLVKPFDPSELLDAIAELIPEQG